MDNHINYNTQHKPDIHLDIVQWFSKLLSYWWLFVIGVGLAFVMSQYYLKNATPLYTSESKLLIKGASRETISEADILVEDLGISRGGKDLGDEIQILSSSPIVKNAIDRIKGNIFYGVIDDDKTTAVYKPQTFVLDTYGLNNPDVQTKFYIKVIDKNYFELRVVPDQIGMRYAFDEQVKNDQGSFLFRRTKVDKAFNGALYEVLILPSDLLVSTYRSRLQIEIAGTKTSSILAFLFTDRYPERAANFLNALTQEYNKADVNENNIIFENSISFIDKRLKTLTQELNDIEIVIQRFKSENKIITENASTSLSFALSELRSAYAELSEYEVESNILMSLEKELSDEAHQLIPPNLNPGLSELINSYNSIYLEQKKLQKTVSNENPILIQNNEKLDNIKKLILLTIQSLKKELRVPISKVKNEIGQLQSEMKGIPVVEMQLLEKIRLQRIKEELYLYLLSRKQEAELSIAITTPNSRIIETAKVPVAPIFPRTKMVRIASVLLAILLVVIIIVAISLFKNTVDTEATLKNLTDIPVIAKIGHYKGEDKVVVGFGKRSAISEMFRSLRTNLNFLNIDGDKQTIMVTSTVSGEGKSMTAINLAVTIALAGKKVILVGMDLRKPKITEYLSSSASIGVTNYLTGKYALEEVINKDETHEGFYYITSGDIPPNPAELIMSDKMSKLIEDLKERFDYVILDTPPLGVVTDALLFKEHITNTLLLVRQNITKKSMVQFLDELNGRGDLVRPSIVFNDVKKSLVNKGYGQYYGAGYYSEK